MTPLNSNSATPIPAHRIEDPARADVLPRHFGRNQVFVENAVYFWASRLSPDYRGAFWDLYEFNQGGFYMAPRAERYRVVVDTNDFEGEMSADAFGITCCLFAFSHLSFQIQDESLAQHYQLLFDLASTHSEARAIFGATD